MQIVGGFEQEKRNVMLRGVGVGKCNVMLMEVGESEEEDKGKEVVDSVLRVLGVDKGDVEYIGRGGENRF